MRVGLAVYDGLGETSGGYRYDRKLVAHLRSQGDDVEVVSIPRRSYGRALLDGLSRSLRRRLDRPFDVLLQDELCHPSLWQLNPRLTRPTAVVSLVHLLRSGGPATRLQSVSRHVEASYLRRVDAALCTSEHTRQRVDDLASLPATVAYPAGRAEGAALSPARVERRARDGPLRLLFLGTLVPRKGVTTLVDALADLDGAWTATLVGRHDADPAYVDRVQRAIDAHGLRDRLSVPGPVPDEELAALLDRAHVLAVPSQYESFGMVYLEAMEHGVVPLGSTVGGASEFVDHGRNGLLVDPGDADGLRRAIASLRDDRLRLASLARGALATARTHPDWSASMTTVREFLRATVDDAAASDASSDGLPDPQATQQRSRGERS
jgi:glycosyltransferase involved in cell wall biosynthesis